MWISLHSKTHTHRVWSAPSPLPEGGINVEWMMVIECRWREGGNQSGSLYAACMLIDTPHSIEYALTLNTIHSMSQSYRNTDRARKIRKAPSHNTENKRNEYSRCDENCCSTCCIQIPAAHMGQWPGSSLYQFCLLYKWSGECPLRQRLAHQLASLCMWSSDVYTDSKNIYIKKYTPQNCAEAKVLIPVYDTV